MSSALYFLLTYMGGTLHSMVHFLHCFKVAQIKSQQEKEMKGVGEQVHVPFR